LSALARHPCEIARIVAPAPTQPSFVQPRQGALNRSSDDDTGTGCRAGRAPHPSRSRESPPRRSATRHSRNLDHPG
jgi:hypothetical protein